MPLDYIIKGHCLLEQVLRQQHLLAGRSHADSAAVAVVPVAAVCEIYLLKTFTTRIHHHRSAFCLVDRCRSTIIVLLFLLRSRAPRPPYQLHSILLMLSLGLGIRMSWFQFVIWSLKEFEFPTAVVLALHHTIACSILKTTVVT